MVFSDTDHGAETAVNTKSGLTGPEKSLASG